MGERHRAQHTFRQLDALRFCAGWKVLSVDPRIAILVFGPDKPAPIGGDSRNLDVPFRRMYQVSLAAHEIMEGKAAELTSLIGQEIVAGPILQPSNREVLTVFFMLSQQSR